jgi:hypothetical protein
VEQHQAVAGEDVVARIIGCCGGWRRGADDYRRAIGT